MDLGLDGEQCQVTGIKLRSPSNIDFLSIETDPYISSSAFVDAALSPGTLQVDPLLADWVFGT